MTNNSLQINLPEDIEIFQKAIEEYCKAWSNSDGVPNWEYIFSVYANNKGLIFFDAVTPHSFANPEEMKAAYPPVANMSLTPHDDLQVYRRGDLVWTTVTQTIKAKTPDDREMKMLQRQTAIWEERDKRWVMLHEHLSAPSSLQP
ncbi:MAG: nuclear transport factor 2 family protein [Prochloraceae cyanobacterium]|nr:nuclear transport factor 2 family protein [Prochloraceae cyanobacterium]